MAETRRVFSVCLGSARLSAYTRAFQGATMGWGKALAPDNPLLPLGMQDSITPKAQERRIVLSIFLFVALSLIGFFFISLVYSHRNHLIEDVRERVHSDDIAQTDVSLLLHANCKFACQPTDETHGYAR